MGPHYGAHLSMQLCKGSGVDMRPSNGVGQWHHFHGFSIGTEAGMRFL